MLFSNSMRMYSGNTSSDVEETDEEGYSSQSDGELRNFNVLSDADLNVADRLNMVTMPDGQSDWEQEEAVKPINFLEMSQD